MRNCGRGPVVNYSLCMRWIYGEKGCDFLQCKKQVLSSARECIRFKDLAGLLIISLSDWALCGRCARTGIIRRVGNLLLPRAARGPCTLRINHSTDRPHLGICCGKACGIKCTCRPTDANYNSKFLLSNISLCRFPFSQVTHSLLSCIF